MAYKRTRMAPKSIQHEGLDPRVPFGKLPRFAIRPINIRLKDTERRLFTYYALQASGFAPAIAEIERQTGIVESNARKARKQLMEKGFISYSGNGSGGDTAIHILWDNIKAISEHMDEAQDGDASN